MTKFVWVDKINNIDDVFADDINAIAKAVIDTQNEIAPISFDIENMKNEVIYTVKIKGTLMSGMHVVSEDPNYNGTLDLISVKKGDAFVVSGAQSQWVDEIVPQIGDMVISIGNNASLGENWIVLNGASLKSAVAEIENNVGNLEDLSTTTKTNVVSAINEVKTETEKRIADLEARLNGINFSTDENGRLNYEKEVATNENNS